MIARVWALALNTYREAVRQKVLFILVFFAAVLILFSLLLGQLSLHAETKVIKDMGLASIFFFGSLISIFIGIGLVFKEVDRRTIYTILSKPVSRAEFILGKFVGLAITVGMIVIAMTVLWFFVLSLYREPLDFQLLKGIVMIYAELCVLIAATLLFSSYSTPFMSSIFSLSFLAIGHLTDDLALIVGVKLWKNAQKSTPLEGLMDKVLLGLIHFLQFFNLDHFVINSDVVHGVEIPWAQIANGWFYAICWVVILLVGATFLFRRKDLQ